MRNLPVVLLLLTASCAAPQASSGEPGWIPLFNGKDLADWTPKIRGHESGDNFARTFRVEDGLLKVSYDGYGGEFKERFGHLFYKDAFSNYRLRMVYRFTGEQCPGGPGWAWRNSGAMLHGQAPETMGKDQSFPVSIEVQLLGGKETGERTNANLCTPGTHVVMDGQLVTRHCTNSTSKTCRGDAWVTVEVEVRGSKLFRHFVDGVPVMEYTAPQLDPGDSDAKPLLRDGKVLLEGGTISLQSESHPLEFKTVELLPLDD